MKWKLTVCVLLLAGGLVFQTACGPSFGGSCNFPKRAQCQSFDSGYSVNEVKVVCEGTKQEDPGLEVVFSATNPCPTDNLLATCVVSTAFGQKKTFHYYKVAGQYDTAEQVRQFCTAGIFTPASN